jgi:hypothetical protein
MGVNLLRVTVARSVSTTLMVLLGPTATTISASGIAAIVSVASQLVGAPDSPDSAAFINVVLENSAGKLR